MSASPLRRLAAGILLCLITGITLAEPQTLNIPQDNNGPDISIERYDADGQRLLLWLPGEWGVTPRQRPTAEALAAAGTEVWLPDLHSSYFIPTGRYSLNDIEAPVIVRLIDAALASGKQVYVMAAGRTTGLTLNAIRLWQEEHTQPASLMGAILLSPNLYLRTPQGGETAEFLPVVQASNTPIYLMQPENAAGYWRLKDTLQALSKGGSPVILQRLMGVSDGFNTRPETRAGEEEMTAQLPQLLEQGMTLLDHYGPTPMQPANLTQVARGAEHAPRGELLRSVPGGPLAPPLSLLKLNGGTLSLDQLKGKPVLVNFWATWCPPCVEEIPSLDRLYRQLHGQGFEVLGVAVGEPPETVRAFLADKAVSFPVLLDPEGTTFRAWQAYAFPTSLILDREHRIRYAVFGAFDWASGDVVRQLMPLVDARATN